MTPREMQARQALDYANQLRTCRASLRREIRALPQHEGCARVVDVLNDQPDELGTMRVEQLLNSIHRFGRRKVARLMILIGAHTSRRLCDLTDRQRKVLCSALETHGG